MRRGIHFMLQYRRETLVLSPHHDAAFSMSIGCVGSKVIANLCVGNTEDKTSNTVVNTICTLRHLNTATRFFNEWKESEKDLKM